MTRNLELEIEMKEICEDVYSYFITDIGIPDIESKQGGATAAYYKTEHMIRFRWNVWNKLDLAGKRLLCIHELWHAVGNSHNSKKLFCTSFDCLSMRIYKRIWGADVALRNLMYVLDKIVDKDIKQENEK